MASARSRRRASAMSTAGKSNGSRVDDSVTGRVWFADLASRLELPPLARRRNVGSIGIDEVGDSHLAEALEQHIRAFCELQLHFFLIDRNDTPETNTAAVRQRKPVRFVAEHG